MIVPKWHKTNRGSLMIRILALLSLAALVGCGGGGYKKADRLRMPSASAPMASGPISRACMASDRKARSRQLCGCIQAVADLTLSKRDQSLAASFYQNPQRAQDIRQSDNAGHERFWLKYKDYAQTSEAICG